MGAEPPRGQVVAGGVVGDRRRVGDQRAGRRRHALEEVVDRPGQRDHERLGVGRRVAVDLAEDVRGRAGDRGLALERLLHGGAVDGGAVGEGDAVAQVERVGQAVVGDRPVLGQHALDVGAPGHVPHQALVDGVGHRHELEVEEDVGVDLARVRDGQRQRPAGRAGRRALLVGAAGRDQQHERGERDQQGTGATVHRTPR